MFTMVAFSESLDPAGVYVNLAGVPDQHVKVEGDAITVPEFNHLIGAHGCLGTTAAQLRLVSPSLRRVNPNYVTPLVLGLDNALWAKNSVDPSVAIPLEINEALEIQENSNPAGAEQHTALVWLAPGAIVPISGEIHTIRAEITLALLAGAWSFSEMDFADELPVGEYAVVGLSGVISTGVGLRLVPVGSPNRHGVPVSELVDDPEVDNFRKGRMGEFCRFNSITPPGVEVIGSAAVGAATYQIFLDIMLV